MSSRIIRGKPLEAAQPLKFRSIHGIAKTCEPGSQESQQSSRYSEAEWEARIRAAYDKGVQEGRHSAEGMASARAQEIIRPSVDAFRTLMADLSRSQQRIRGEAEEDIVKLSLAIARRVLHRELATDPEALLGLVRAAWDRVDARETQRLRLSPEDARLVEQHRAALNLPPRVEIVGDSGLPRGSALFDTSRGTLDASISTQLTEIDRGLADVLARRKGA